MKAIYFVPFIAVAAFTADAHAGISIDAEVVIDTASSTAYGGFGGAYHSTDTNQQIGCYIDGDSTTIAGYCGAIDASGNEEFCIFPQGAMPALGAFTRDSVLVLSWDNNSNCTNISVASLSAYSPK
jgi:hypothetical protein